MNRPASKEGMTAYSEPQVCREQGIYGCDGARCVLSQAATASVATVRPLPPEASLLAIETKDPACMEERAGLHMHGGRASVV